MGLFSNYSQLPRAPAAETWLSAKLVNASSFVIITGLSGSGKGTFLRALEDRGYFCVDNLPVQLLGKFLELTLKSESEGTKVALGIDVREGEGLRELPEVYAELRRQPGVQASL